MVVEFQSRDGETTMNIARTLGDLAENLVAGVVMLVFAVLSFFVTVFIISTGAQLAGYAPDGNFAVLSAAIIVAATILAGLMK
jgi:hypothetical protein